MEHSEIRVKRVYDKPARHDGVRMLVDRLWPCGLKKDAARLDHWLKDVAPSDELRRWFRHDPGRWQSFVERYFNQLDSKPEAIQPIVEAARTKPVTLLYAARDPEHNNAVALRDYVLQRSTRPAP